MSDPQALTLSKPSELKDLVNDLDQLLGLGGNFWAMSQKAQSELETPEQIQDFCRDSLVTLFGLEVQGL